MKNTINVTNTETGEVKTFDNVTMMVAPNGMVFVKKDKRVVWCSAAVNFIAEEVLPNE